jgi:AraC-like DNA-binding protein
MPTTEWARSWHDPDLDLRLLHAYYINHAYPRHSHDYYVVGLVDAGRQSFLHEGRRHVTPPGGVILINPGAVHTGEAAAAEGFHLRCLYPTVAQMQAAAFDLTGRRHPLPAFTHVRVDDPAAAASLAALHTALTHDASPLERETRLRSTLAFLLARFGEPGGQPSPLGRERQAVQQARRYLEEHLVEGARLDVLAAHVALSPYHLLRAFRAETGLTPHAYLDNLRIRRAEQLIAAGRPLAEVAAETGFSSQSHLTRRFRQIIGVTPGQYARQRAA